MANINIKTTKLEQEQVLVAIKVLHGRVVSIAKIADQAGMRSSRVRYVVADLLDADLIEREPIKAFNAHYIRYRYTVKK